MADFELRGFEEIQNKIKELGDKAIKSEEKALKRGIKPIHEEMKKRAPKSNSNKGHAVDYLKIGDIENIDGIKTITAGIQKSDNSEAYYLKFWEWGWVVPTSRTSKKHGKTYVIKNGGRKIAARPFMKPSYKAKKKEAQDEMIKSIKEDLGL